jgi:hypothetical protein
VISFGHTKNIPPIASWQDGLTYGLWTDQWSGYGVIAPQGVLLSMAPEVSLAPAQTSSCLVTSVQAFAGPRIAATLTTVKQLRTGSPPNPWEVAWLLWNFTDNTHFYALTLQPNGWELSKQDPAYPGNQRFLATGSVPLFPVGSAYGVEVVQSGGTITAWVNGLELVSFTDSQTPYLAGNLGLYCEDSSVLFAPPTVNGVLLPFP